MTKLLKNILFAALILAAMSAERIPESVVKDLRIAFMADVHLQDVYGEFQDSDYLGVRNPKNGKFATIRTMEAQLHSTRIFNENYFAFLAALDDVARRRVKYVVLPGDFSDDGQPVNLRGLKRILDEYSKKHGITFLATTGNHDPVKPYSREAGKRDFLGEGGRQQPIISRKGMYGSGDAGVNPAVITKDIQQLGYLEIVNMLGDFGFFPKEEHLYWETPFSSYDPDTYRFSRAVEESSLENRQYPVPPQGTMIPDVSYLVEPVNGLWLLALDANVYIPEDHVTSDPENPNNYSGAGVGYNNVLTHKKHLISWVKKVASLAEKSGKTLITFSHYPMVEFNDDTSHNINDLLGAGAMQLDRVPGEDVAQIFADAGIAIHFGGHMHINDTGIRRTKKGNTLVNIQIPSLAAYIPAYKLLTIKENQMMEVETIVVDSVPRFNEMFDLYLQEYDYLKSTGSKRIWNRDILSANNYHDFTSWHLKELVRLRYLPEEWPSDLTDTLLKLSGEDLLITLNSDSKISFEESVKSKVRNNSGSIEYWRSATQKAKTNAAENGLKLEQFSEWTGFDLIFDFYRLRNADRLAVKDIGSDRIRQYQLIFDLFLSEPQDHILKDDTLFDNFKDLAKIFQKFLKGAPADHFQVDLKTGKVEDLSVDKAQDFPLSQKSKFQSYLVDPKRIIDVGDNHYFIDF